MKILFKHPLFVIGLVLKTIALFFFASKFPSEFFIPFLDKAVLNLGENPWTLSHPSLFPYGSVLFLILFIPKIIIYLLFHDAGLGVEPLSLFALKFPLLIADIFLFYYLARLAHTRWKNLLWLYWLNPVFFYISYIYGQLDIVSTMFVVTSIYHIVKRNFGWAGFCFGLATACKFHVVALLPLFLIYIWNNYFKPDSLKKMSQLFFVWLAVSVVGFLPLIFSGNAGYASLGSPEIQRLFAAKLDLGEQTYLYLSILVVSLVVGRIIISTRITELGLIFGAGALFTAILLTSRAATGWYFWSIPFIALFYSMYLNVNSLLFWSFNLFFIIVRPLQDYSLFNNWIMSSSGNVLWNILYAGLQASLFANLVAIWVVAIKKEAPAMNRAKPICIGISGDSGSGKSLTTELLFKVFGSQNVSVIEGDNYHKWERGDDNWKSFTHLNPLANRLLSLYQHTKSVLMGQAFLNSEYDHETGKFTQVAEIKPSKTLVIQGLHSFFLKEMRDLYDLKIFLSPDFYLRMAWKIQRDCLQRGYDRQKVLNQMSLRTEDSKLFIDSQKEYADLIFEFFPTQNLSEEQAKNGVVSDLGLKIIAWNTSDLNQLSNELLIYGVKTNLNFLDSTVDRLCLTIMTPPTHQVIVDIANKLFPRLRHITRSSTPPVFAAGYDGFIQLVVIWILEHKLNSALLEDSRI